MREPDDKPTVWMDIAHQLRRLSRDPSTQVGCVILDSRGFQIASSYNGPPPQVNDHLVPWQERRADRLSKYNLAFHSEVGAIYAAVEAHGFSRLAGSTMYVTGHPCPNCFLHIIRSGIRRVVWDSRPEVQPKCVDESQRKIVREMIGTLKGYHILVLEPFHKEATDGHAG